MNYTEADICDWYKAGDSLPVIKRRLGRSQCYVDGVLKRNGVAKRPPGRLPGLPRPERQTPASVIDEAIALYRQGLRADLAGQRVGISKTTVLRALKEQGVPIRSQRIDMADEICARYQAGQSSILISRELGISKRLVLRELSRRQVERRKDAGHAHDEAIVRRYQAGASATDIANGIGCASAFVFAVLRRNGVPPRRPTRKNIPLDLDEIRRLYATGRTPDEIGLAMGVTGAPIIARLKAAGVPIRKWVDQYEYVSPVAGPIKVNGTWERGYAEVLDALFASGKIASWSYSPDRIRLPTGREYIPDFLVVGSDGARAYHEVKGRMWDKAKAKIQAARSIGVNVVVLRRRTLSPIFKHFGVRVVL